GRGELRGFRYAHGRGWSAGATFRSGASAKREGLSSPFLLRRFLPRRHAGTRRGSGALVGCLLARRPLRLHTAGGRLSGDDRLRLVFLRLLVGHRLRLGLLDRRRMELRTQMDQQAHFLMRLYAHQQLVLRIVQELTELLKAVALPIERGLL